MSYLTFHETIPNPARKTAIWEVRSGEQQILLGQVRWYAAWRRYCFTTVILVWMDATCLQEVTDFLTKQMDARKKKEEADVE